jgi:hypothetical protein
MKIENRKIAAQYWSSFPARGPALLAWSSGKVAQPNHASLRCARVLGVVTAGWPHARRHGRPELTGGQGVARAAGTPRGSDGGCAEQGGAGGFPQEMAGGSGAEKRVQRDGVSRRWWSSDGWGGHRRGLAATRGDRGGEARSKRGGRRGTG